MRSLFFNAMLASLLMISGVESFAGTEKAKPFDSQLSTELEFSGTNVDGRYNRPGEALIKIEDDKKLKDILSIRTHFRDRVEKSKSRD